MRTQATLAAMHEGAKRGAAEMRAQREAGLAFARAWKAGGGPGARRGSLARICSASCARPGGGR